MRNQRHLDTAQPELAVSMRYICIPEDIRNCETRVGEAKRGRRTKKGGGLGRSRMITPIIDPAVPGYDVYQNLIRLGAANPRFVPGDIPLPPWPEVDLQRYERALQAFIGLRRLGFDPNLSMVIRNEHTVARYEQMLDFAMRRRVCADRGLL